MTGLTKSFFNCKTSTRALNYSYATYTKQSTNDTTMEFSNLPSSTMIESRANYDSSSTSMSYQLMSTTTTTSSNTFPSSIQTMDNVSTIEREQQSKPTPSFITIPSFNYTECESDYLLDTEYRRSSIASATTYQADSSCETVIRHNNSPISDYKSHQPDETSTILYECLHSTKISASINQSCERCHQCQMNETSLSPFSTKSKLNLDSPLLSSSTMSASPKLFVSQSSLESQSVQPYESMITYLSSTVNDENATHICTSNYEATFVDDVSVKFADMVKILSSNKNNDEWVQVQVASDGRIGFVPKNIVLDIKQFINQLKQTANHSNATLSTIN